MFKQNSSIESYINMLIKTKDKCEDKIQELENEFNNLPAQSIDVFKKACKMLAIFTMGTVFASIIFAKLSIILSAIIINLILYSSLANNFKKFKSSYNRINTLSNFQTVIEQKIEIFSKANKLNINLKNDFTVEKIFGLEKQYENDIKNICNSNIDQLYQVYQAICDEYKKDNIYSEYLDRKQESYDKYISTQEKSFLTEEDNTIDVQFDFGFFNNQYDYSVNTENQKVKQKTLKKF